MKHKKDITPDDIKACAKGQLKNKVEELHKSIKGFFTDHHRNLLRSLLRLINSLEIEIENLNQRIHSVMSSNKELIDQMSQCPGLNEISSSAILAELGITLETFPTMEAISSWSGVCPGNNESAGKRHSGRSPVRNHHLKTLLIEAAWSAIKVKGSYYKAKYYRLKARRGSNKAIVAIAHRLLKAIYHIIKNGASYQELGQGHLIRKDKVARLRRLQKQAQEFGFRLVPVNP